MFDKTKISELYPEAEELMIEPAFIWKLPSGKEHMLSEVCSNGEYFLQEKIDGGFYQFVKTENFCYLFGRTISKTTGILTEKGGNTPHLMEALGVLPAGTILVGEIFVPGGTSKDVTHIMGCLPAEAIRRQGIEGNIHYYCHDILAYEGVNLMQEGAETRYRILEAIWNLHSLDSYDFLRLAVKVDTGIEDEIFRILNEGGEGVVLKKKTAPYTPGKRPAWDSIKIKQMASADLIVTRTIDATKEYTGKSPETWVYWESEDGLMRENICHYGEKGWIPVTRPYYFGWKTSIGVGAYDENGKLVEIGTISSGITDEMAELMARRPDDYIGHVCYLEGMSIDSKELTLRHFGFKYMREDKNPHECLLAEIF